MKTLVYLSLLTILFACSKDPYDYTIEEVYKDYYVKEEVDKALNFREKALLDLAEQSYVSRGKDEKLAKMTVRELLKEQDSYSQMNEISKVVSIIINDKNIINNSYGEFIKWKVKAKNNSDKVITELKGWLLIIDSKSKEIFRKDTIDFAGIIGTGKSTIFYTSLHDYNPKIPANEIVKKIDIKLLNKSLEWKPTYIRFKDESEMTNTDF